MEMGGEIFNYVQSPPLYYLVLKSNSAKSVSNFHSACNLMKKMKF